MKNLKYSQHIKGHNLVTQQQQQQHNQCDPTSGVWENVPQTLPHPCVR